MRALSKDRASRQRTLGELVQELQMWLESESDRARRHERAEEKAEEARVKLAQYFGRKDEVKRLEVEAEEVGKRFEPWQPRREKAELFAAQVAVVASGDDGRALEYVNDVAGREGLEAAKKRGPGRHPGRRRTCWRMKLQG
jgi:hypothetical protein